MNEILEFKRPMFVVNHDLDKYEDIDSFPEKTQLARESIAKYGLPKEWQEEYDQIIRDKSFWIDGILCQADIETHTFWVVVEATHKQPETRYAVTTPSTELWAKLVKEYWNNKIQVHIKPKTDDVDGVSYEFVEMLL